MAVWSTVQLAALPEAFRLDAEYYQPEYLRFEHWTRNGQPLREAVKGVLHPIEITRIYSESGVRILLAQNIRQNYLDHSAAAFMPENVRTPLARNRLKPGDVVMTRSGANFGDTACYLGEPPDIFACADCLIIRPDSIPAGYLSTFFNSRIGRGLLTRGAYGAAQPHIAPSYLKGLRIPRMTGTEATVHALVVEAHGLRKKSETIYQQTEAILTATLGLDRVDLTPCLFYEDTYAHAAAAVRLDAEYFSPRMQNVIETLSAGGKTIGDVAPLAKRRFKAVPGKPFDYIEISDIGTAGTAGSNTVAGEDAPSRATWIVKPGDIITTTVRPIRRLSAIILPEQDGFVSSSGFAVLRPRDIEPELLLTYLRLPLVAELLDLHTTASMYPAISTTDLLRIPFRLPECQVREEIVNKIRQSFAARAESQRLLQKAKQIVEQAIMGPSETALSL
jgi:hypothetical protein